MKETILCLILAVTYMMVIAKRTPALVRNFRYQSALIFLITLASGIMGGHVDLCIVAFLILFLKVFVIPYVLNSIAKKINVDENLGLFVNPQLSLIVALVLTYCSGVFAHALGSNSFYKMAAITVALSVISVGAFLMVSRMKAFTQLIGLLVMENGIFIFASFLSAGMPFFVEVAIALDIFMSVVIMGIFVYRINRLFTHIDVNKLSRLRG